MDMTVASKMVVMSTMMTTAHPLEPGDHGWEYCSCDLGSSPQPRRPSQTPSSCWQWLSLLRRLHHHRKEDHDQESHLAPNILDLCSETCNLANRVGDFSSRQVLNNLCLIFDTLWYTSVARQERKRFWRHHQNLFRNPILKKVNHLIQFSKTLLQIGLEVSSASFQV